MSNTDNKLNELRADDGFYRDGIEVLRLMIGEVNASNLADDLTLDLRDGLDLPAGAVSVELNGGVPIYLVQDPYGPGEFEQATFSEIVGYLEGAHCRGREPADEEPTDQEPTDQEPVVAVRAAMRRWQEGPGKRLSPLHEAALDLIEAPYTLSLDEMVNMILTELDFIAKRLDEAGVNLEGAVDKNLRLRSVVTRAYHTYKGSMEEGQRVMEELDEITREWRWWVHDEEAEQ